MERRPLLAYEAEKKPAKCEAPYSAEKISGTQEYIISRKSGKTIEIELQALEPNDAIDITLSCRSEVKITKTVFSTEYHNTNLAENLENQYRVYKAAKAQLKKEWEPLSPEAGFGSRNSEYGIVLDPMLNAGAFRCIVGQKLGKKSSKTE